MSTPMTYYTSCFQKKPCSCCQICGPLNSSGILRQWLGKFLCSPRRPLLGARAEGDKAGHASPPQMCMGRVGLAW